MKTRTLAILIASSAFAAHAQETTAPPIVIPENQAPAAECASARDCPRGSTCTGYRDLGDGKWSKGICQELGGGQACTSNRDCGRELVCAGFQDLGNGKWSQGTCMSRDARAQTAPGEPAGLRHQDTNAPGRFKYTGSVPAGFHLISQPRMRLVGAGIAALAGGHALSILAAALTSRPLGVIPIAGPAILAVQWWDSSSSGFAGLGNFFILLICGIDFAAQVVGVVLMSMGLAAPEQWLERDVAKPGISLVPFAPGAPLGASLLGRF